MSSRSRFPSGSSTRSARGSPSTPRSTGSINKALVAGSRDRAMWVFALLALVVVAVAVWIANGRYENVHVWARLPSWLATPFMLLVVVTVALLLAAVATAYAYRHGNATWKSVVPALFLFVAFLFLVVAFTTYRSNNFLVAFYMSLLLNLALLMHIYGVSASSPSMYVAAMLPLLFLTLTVSYVLWFMSDASSDSIHRCLPSYDFDATTFGCVVSPAAP